jgi:hypothetical protein
MTNSHIAVIKNELKLSRILTDIFIVTGILVIPIISHSLSIPFYLIEPMRLAVVYVLLFDSKYHAYRLAIMLPFFSYMFTGHPFLLKALLICLELCVQVFSINYFRRLIPRLYLIVIASVFVSKLFYYTLKWSFLQLNFINGHLISTSLVYQLIPIIILSISCLLLFPQRNNIDK